MLCWDVGFFPSITHYVHANISESEKKKSKIVNTPESVHLEVRMSKPASASQLHSRELSENSVYNYTLFPSARKKVQEEQSSVSFAVCTLMWVSRRHFADVRMQGWRTACGRTWEPRWVAHTCFVLSLTCACCEAGDTGAVKKTLVPSVTNSNERQDLNFTPIKV